MLTGPVSPANNSLCSREESAEYVQMLPNARSAVPLLLVPAPPAMKASIRSEGSVSPAISIAPAVAATESALPSKIAMPKSSLYQEKSLSATKGAPHAPALTANSV